MRRDTAYQLIERLHAADPEWRHTSTAALREIVNALGYVVKSDSCPLDDRKVRGERVEILAVPRDYQRAYITGEKIYGGGYTVYVYPDTRTSDTSHQAASEHERTLREVLINAATDVLKSAWHRR